MKTIEEQIWTYIDGDCDPVEKLEIERKIASDPAYQQLYSEFMQLHALIEAEELDEPSMSFNRNVMEKVNLEIAPVALKTKVDQRIIYSIAAFFVLSTMSIVIYAIASSTFTMPQFDTSALHFDVGISAAMKSLSIKSFLFLDLVLALVYLDRVLRKRLA
jgi:anti-sigma factor RsiW